MKGFLVITLSEAIGIAVVALIILVSIGLAVRTAIRQALCKHTDLTPPRTSFGAPGGGYGWQCKRCGKDFGWGERPPADNSVQPEQPDKPEAKP